MLTYDHNWAMVCRRDFDLSPREVATLAAVSAYVLNVGTPMPRAELDALGARGEVDVSSPGRLADLGLLRLHGYREARCYSPTAAGIARLER
jgi:hypothetical protein